MNRLTGLNGFDLKKLSASNPNTPVGDKSEFGIPSPKGKNSKSLENGVTAGLSNEGVTKDFSSQDAASAGAETNAKASEDVDSDNTNFGTTNSDNSSSVNSGATDYAAVYHAKISLFGDQAGALLSGDAFDAIFGSGNQAEKNSNLKTMAVVKESSPLFFSPLHYESRYEYPLIVWLHGCGSSERELEELMPYISIRNYVAVAPRGTKAVDPNGHRYTWAQTPASIALAEELVFDAIEKASTRYSVANRKIFLAGRGTGGTMAWRLALRNPKQFAGCVSLGGVFPKSHRPLATLKDLRHLRSLWMVGEQSQNCGIDSVVESLPLFHSAKLRVAIRQYNCGDELYADMFNDMNRWLMEIVTNQTLAPVEDSCVWGGLSGLN